jgi:hypothetical protein
MVPAFFRNWDLIRLRFVIGVVLILLSSSSFAQLSVEGHLGISYIEHVSTGLTLRVGRNHSFTALYGSNIFINTRDFSNLFAQYDFSIPKWTVRGAIPRIGVKGGNSFYTNEYYRWKVVSLIPFAGVRYPINEKFQLLFEAGPVYSFEQYVERIKGGEIGHYRYVLLELKVAVGYTLFTRKKR